MKLISAGEIHGVMISNAKVFSDHRGDFSRFTPDFENPSEKFYVAISRNSAPGTIRGFHLQKPPYAEEKNVSCLNGSILDVIIDLRKNSSTFGCWAEIEMSATNAQVLHVPHGVAHGFQTLTENTIVQYLLTSQYVDSSTITLNPFYNSKINWSKANPIVSDKDRYGLDFEAAASIFHEAQNKA